MVRTKHIKVYEFGELKPEIQEKVITDNSEINIYDDWYEYLYEDFKEDLKKYGLSCNCFYWDLYRGNSFYMDKVIIENEDLLLKNCISKTDKSKKMLNEIENENEDLLLNIGNNGYSNYLENYEGIDEETAKNINELLEDLNKRFLKWIRQEYDYLISDESIKETIISNELEFLKNGDRF